MPHRTDSLHDRIHVELIRSLFATTTPSIIMSVGFIVSAWLICLTLPEPGLVAVAIVGGVTSVVRIASVYSSLKEAGSETLSVNRATLLERRFATSYLTFAASLGVFSAYVLTFNRQDAHMLAICLIVGYAAGVAAGVGLRPRIAIPSMIVAVVPSSVVALSLNNMIHAATGVMLAAFLAGGVVSLLDRHKRTNVEIGQRISFAGLARRDALTALPNRLALREWFDNIVSPAAGEGVVAVHCLDLDGFKPINDRFGHPTGDELLRAVARRLAGSLRSGDIAARMGGDEFVIVQSTLGHIDEAQLLAQRICRSLKAPFDVGGRQIQVSSCVGFVTSADKSEDLDDLIGFADQALYVAKRSHGSVVRFDRGTGRMPALIAA